MKYKEMISNARASGIANERAMFASIDAVDELLEEIRTAHPDKYKHFMRVAHADIFGPHYDDDFAASDVAGLIYTDNTGAQRHGPHWTPDEINQATNRVAFPDGTTPADKYVAYNVMYSDLCKVLNDDQIIAVASAFFFSDEDAPAGKVWRYMAAMHG